MAKLLIIEDDALLARLYQKNFTKDGHDVVVVRDGVEGLETIEEIKPDLVLLDIMMPKMSGLEMLERIKANPATSDVPVIVLTNLDGEEEQGRALELGAVTYIVKSDQQTFEVVSKVKEVLAATMRGDGLPGAVSLD